MWCKTPPCTGSALLAAGLLLDQSHLVFGGFLPVSTVESHLTSDFQSVLHLCGLYISYISWGFCYVNLNIVHCHSCGGRHQRLVMSLHVWMRHGDCHCTSSKNTSTSAWDDQSGRATLQGSQRISDGSQKSTVCVHRDTETSSVFSQSWPRVFFGT